MSESENDQFSWRDTYFVWFTSSRRPTMAEVEKVLRSLPDKYGVEHPEQDEAGRFDSITLQSPLDHAVLEVSYLEGPDIREQAQTLAEELKAAGDCEPAQLHRLAQCDARFDVMQFERLETGDDDEDLEDEMFDPSALLVVMQALTKLVGGIGVDPQSGLMV